MQLSGVVGYNIQLLHREIETIHEFAHTKVNNTVIIWIIYSRVNIEVQKLLRIINRYGNNNNNAATAGKQKFLEANV